MTDKISKVIVRKSNLGRKKGYGCHKTVEGESSFMLCKGTWANASSTFVAKNEFNQSRRFTGEMENRYVPITCLFKVLEWKKFKCWCQIRIWRFHENFVKKFSAKFEKTFFLLLF